jgi:hypothetical protein
MNRKGLIALGAVAMVGKIIASLALAMLLARCSDPSTQSLKDRPLEPSEFDYSLGKSETQSKTNSSKYTPQNYNYGRNQK